MPYLAWDKSPDDLEMSPPGEEPIWLRLRLDLNEARELAEWLREINAGEASELRHTISGQWNLFWKKREGESRLLVAHPEHESWVATLALTADHLQEVANALDGLGTSPFSLGTLRPLGEFSNFNLRMASR